MEIRDYGDYVLATKYSDGDPRDQWCVGFFLSMTDHNPPRYNIVDSDGKLFRGNGFRKAKKISAKRGAWLLENKSNIELLGRSLWWWSRQKMDKNLIMIRQPTGTWIHMDTLFGMGRVAGFDQAGSGEPL